jgi:hypothetical protein
MPFVKRKYFNNTVCIAVGICGILLFSSACATQPVRDTEPAVAPAAPQPDTEVSRPRQPEGPTPQQETPAPTQEPQIAAAADEQPASPSGALDRIPQPNPKTKPKQTGSHKPRDRKAFMEALKEKIKQRVQEKMRQKEGAQLDMPQTATSDEKLPLNPQDRNVPQTEEEQLAMERAERKLQTDITGLVIDQTISPFGSHFYDKFYITFDPPEISQAYNIYITEQASPSFGFILRVRVDDYVIWAKNLKPRFSVIEESVIEARQRATAFLVNYEAMLRQLGGNDMKGDGII